MPKETPEVPDLDVLDFKIIYYVYKAGPAYIKKLAQRMHGDLETIREHLKKLQQLGLLERVSKRMVDYRISRHSKATKHRNHTYYEVTRKGRRFVRDMPIDVEVDLKPPYKRS